MEDLNLIPVDSDNGAIMAAYGLQPELLGKPWFYAKAI